MRRREPGPENGAKPGRGAVDGGPSREEGGEPRGRLVWCAGDRYKYEYMGPGEKLPVRDTVVMLMFAMAVFGLVPLMALSFGPSERWDLPWWKTSVIYQIYPRSFQDSNGDGVGDIQGIISRLDYLQSLGVGAIWLNPIYTSPMRDFGYDVSDFRDIDPVFGTMKDFDELLDKVHKSGMKLIMEYIPNHTSDQHKWFQASRQGAHGPYADYYVWHDGIPGDNSTRLPPSNWASAFGGSAWSWDEQRQQFYLHQFAIEQPDLNWRNTQVQEDMWGVMEFWLSKGVDGLRVDAVDFLVETEDVTRDEPHVSGHLGQADFDSLLHLHTRHQPETYNITKQWRQRLDRKDSPLKNSFLLLETHDPDPLLSRWKSHYTVGDTTMPFNFYLMEAMTPDCGGHCVKDAVDTVVRVTQGKPVSKWMNWVIGNHDQPRITTRFTPQFTTALNMLNLLLPGTATTYYGEELGMEDVGVPYKDALDPKAQYGSKAEYKTYSRDGCRSPMQWSPEENAGFTSKSGVKTWLPVHPEYTTNNVMVQQSDPRSTLSKYKDLVRLRLKPAIQTGKMEILVSNDNIFSFVRYAFGRFYTRILIAVNVGRRESRDNYVMKVGKVQIPVNGTVVFDNRAEPATNTVISLSDVLLKPGEGIVVEFPSNAF